MLERKNVFDVLECKQISQKTCNCQNVKECRPFQIMTGYPDLIMNLIDRTQTEKTSLVIDSFQKWIDRIKNKIRDLYIRQKDKSNLEYIVVNLVRPTMWMIWIYRLRNQPFLEKEIISITQHYDLLLRVLTILNSEDLEILETNISEISQLVESNYSFSSLQELFQRLSKR